MLKLTGCNLISNTAIAAAINSLYLIQLHFGCTSVDNGIMHAIKGNLPQLESLDISGLVETFDAFSFIKKCPNLKRLVWCGGALKDELLNTILMGSSLSNLEVMVMGHIPKSPFNITLETLYHLITTLPFLKKVKLMQVSLLSEIMSSSPSPKSDHLAVLSRWLARRMLILCEDPL